MDANQMSQKRWTTTDLEEVGVPITPAMINTALKNYWEAFARHNVHHKKVYVKFDTSIDGWREGALLGSFGSYSGVKDIHVSPGNEERGMPVRHTDIILRKKDTGDLLMFLEANTISNSRTGWFALACLDLLLKGQDCIQVFLFGAGPVAQAAILALNEGASGRIQRIVVLSRSRKTNHDLVEKLRSKVQFVLEAVDDRRLLPQAKFVITATNAGRPLFEVNEIASSAVTLSLGIDDMPPAYFDRLLADGGLLIGDDLVEMESRNVDPLALYYSRRGMKLTEEGRRDGVKCYSEVLENPELMEKLKTWNGPALFIPVGLGSLDIAVAAHVHEMLAKKINKTI